MSTHHILYVDAGIGVKSLYNKSTIMYYRRKVLLALIEAFGGNLQNTDCEMLIFNFCQQTGKNHYNFFPYEHGPASFVLNYDKGRLVQLGLLKPAGDFQLNTTLRLRSGQAHSYLNELTPVEKSDLLNFKSAIGNLRGDQLVKKTDREFPQFVSRSKIAERLFDAGELKQIQSAWNTDTKPIVFSIGYEGLTIDSFLNQLIANNITIVVDVRNNPQSMKYGFSKKSFKQYIESAGMKYIHIPELGIPSAMRKGLDKYLSHEDLFRIYESQILPKQDSAVNQLLELTNENERSAIVCFEADYHFCHRHTLIEYLQKDKAFKRTVVHL